jgi:hypothetical protein
MPLFMDDTEDIEDTSFDFVTDHVRKWAAFPAGKTVWADVVTAFPPNNCSDDLFDAVVEVSAEAF